MIITRLPTRTFFQIILIGILFLGVSLACSMFSTGNMSYSTPATSGTPSSGNEPQITQGEASQNIWETTIWNTPPDGFGFYPKTFINSGLVPPFLTIFPSYSVNEVSIVPPLSPSWNASHGGINFKIYRSYFISNDFIYTLDTDQHATKLDLQNAHAQWTSSLKGSLLGVSDTNVYINNEDNRLYALDKNTGAEKWHVILNSLVPSGTNIYPSSEIMPYDGLIIVPVGTGQPNPNFPKPYGYFALKEDTGELAWTFFLDGYEALFLKDGVIFTEHTVNGPQGYQGYQGINALDGKAVYNLISSSSDDPDPFAMRIDYFNPSDGTLIYDYYSAPFNYIYHFVAINVVTGTSIWAQDIVIENENWVTFQTITDKYAVFSTIKEFLIFEIPSGNKVAEVTNDRLFASYFTQNNNAVMSFPELGTTQGMDLATQKQTWDNEDLNLSSGIFKTMENDMNPAADPFPSQVIRDILIVSDPTTNETMGINTLDGKVLWSKRLVGESLVNEFSGDIGNQSFLHDFCKVYNQLLFCSEIDTHTLFALDPKTGHAAFQVNVGLGYIMTLQHVKGDSWLVQDLMGNLSLMRLIQR